MVGTCGSISDAFFLQHGRCNILQLDTDATLPSVWEAEWLFQLGCRPLADSTANIVLFLEPPCGVNAGAVLTRKEATQGWQDALGHVAALYLERQDEDAGRRLLTLLYAKPDPIPVFSSALARGAAYAQHEALGVRCLSTSITSPLCMSLWLGSFGALTPCRMDGGCTAG